MSLLVYLGLLCFALIGIFYLTAFKRASKFSKYELGFHSSLIFLNESDALRFFTLTTLNTLRVLFVFVALLFIQKANFFPFSFAPQAVLGGVVTLLVLIGLFVFPGELLQRSFVKNQSAESFAKISSFFIHTLILITYPLYLLSKSFSMTAKLSAPELKVKQELVDLIHDAETGDMLAPEDKEMIESVVSFPNRIAREVMIPRVAIFALSSKTSIQVAAEKCIEEGYSRVPVYKNSVDEIIGILMFKDLLLKYMEHSHSKDEKILSSSIDSLVKKTLFTPETKKISSLLQEFRKKQQHIAIVVDEYGGTEGIITIEDILEEIVGEIADEYDEDPELFAKMSNGSWIIDTRMNILDIEEELSIQIPQDGEYDTISGYIYHRTGTIPNKGFVIDHDDFRIEILKSGERGVEKVRLTPKKQGLHEH